MVKKKVEEEVVQETPVEVTEETVEATEEVSVEEVVQDTEVAETASEEVTVSDIDGEVVAEFTQQLGIFSTFIYNARNEDVTLVVDNLGYGDIYVSEKADVEVGVESQRVLFKEQRVFKGATKLFFTSASQPVASVIEIKE